MKNIEPLDVSRDSDKFMLRLPDGMRSRISEMAKTNGRSMNAEIIATLQHSMNAQNVELSQVASGVLLDEVIARYGAKLQIVMPKDAT